jgi:hypothetical protein
MRNENLTYPADLLDIWKSGDLAKQWMAECPELFGARDYRIVRNQSPYHFGEWFVARHYWKCGHRVLIEKYAFPSHPDAYRIASQLLGNAGIQFIHAKRLSCQPPDLLVYQPDMSRFFFAEVKRGRDRLKLSQQKFFEELERRFECEVVLVSLQPEALEQSSRLRTAITRNAIDNVVSFIPKLKSIPAGEIASVSRSEREVDGSLTIDLDLQYHPTIDALIHDLYDNNFIQPFDWGRWGAHAKRYVNSPERLSHASLSTCINLLTLHIRRDRFCGGHLGEMVECGHIAGVLRRLKALRSTLQ